VNTPPSLRPKTSGKYISEAVAGITWNSPGTLARIMYVILVGAARQIGGKERHLLIAHLGVREPPPAPPLPMEPLVLLLGRQVAQAGPPAYDTRRLETDIDRLESGGSGSSTTT
jgi:hypothetical protein